MEKMDMDGDYDNSSKSESKSKGRRSMGGSLEQGVSSREVIKSKAPRGEDAKMQAPKSSSESVGGGMTIVQ